MPRHAAVAKLGRPAIFFALAALMASYPIARLRAQALPANPLPEPHGFLVTGNYAVGSFDFPAQATRGTETGTIHVVTCPSPQTNPATLNCVPANADIIAAYLYWETIDVSPQPTSFLFQNQPVVDPQVANVVKRSDQPITGAACFGSGSGQPLTLTMFRADVRQLLPLQFDATGQTTGRRLAGDGDLVANGYPAGLSVQTLDGGTGNVLPQVAGASLVVVFSTSTEPLRRVMIYENPATTASQAGGV